MTQNRTLFERGYLSPIKYTREEFDSAQLSLNSTGAEFTEKSVHEYWAENDLTGKIVRHVKESTAPSILIFVDYYQEAVKLQRRLQAIGHEPAIVTGETEQRQRDNILEAFKSGKQRIVINMGVLTVGFDYPALACVINGRVTNSLRLYYQILGRLIRTHESKEYGHYIDLGGNVTRFGRVENFEICGPKGLERLKCGDRYLTGVDLKTGEDLEQKRLKKDAGSDTIHFGIHKGQKYAELPGGYLNWIIDNFSDGPIKEKAQDEVQRRLSGGLREGGIANV